MKSADSDAARFAQNTILTVVGGLIGGTAGAIALPVLAKKAQQKQAEAVNTSINNILKSGKSNVGTTLTNEDMNTLFKAQFEANTVDMYSREPSFLAKTLGITTDPGSSSGTPIYEQPFYKDDDGGIDIDALLPPSESFATPPTTSTTTPTSLTSTETPATPVRPSDDDGPGFDISAPPTSGSYGNNNDDDRSSATERVKAAVASGQKEAKKVTYGGTTRYSGSGR